MIINIDETNREPNDNESVPCLVCREAIRKGAKKCIHCDSYQGRLSHRLSLSSTMLSLLVALVSVSAFAIPIIHKTLNPGADIRATVVGSQENFMQIVVTNVGTQPGTFQWAAIKRPNDDIKKGVKGALHFRLNRIQGSESRLFSRICGWYPVREGHQVYDTRRFSALQSFGNRMLSLKSLSPCC